MNSNCMVIKIGRSNVVIPRSESAEMKILDNNGDTIWGTENLVGDIADMVRASELSEDRYAALQRIDDMVTAIDAKEWATLPPGVLGTLSQILGLIGNVK